MFGTHLSRLGSVHRLGLVPRALAILRSYGTNAHVYLPGIGTVSGLTAGNYLDSAGVTAASVDNPVGLSLDALQAMTLGSELVTNGSNETALVTTTSVANGLLVQDSSKAASGTYSAKYTANTATSTYHQVGIISVSAGKAIWIEYDYFVPTGSLALCRAFDNDDGSWFTSSVSGGIKDQWVHVKEFRSAKATSWNIAIGNNVNESVNGQSYWIDNISVREIPGIHATQATTANKPILRLNSGKYSWQFDGSNDSLSLSAPLFQMSDDHCVIAGCTLGSNATTRYLINTGAGAGSQRVCALFITGTNSVNVGWTDDVTTANIASPSTYPGQTLVVSGVKQANAKRLRINGAQAGSTENTVMGATTLTGGGAIGDWRPSGGNNWIGSIYPVIAIKGTVSDAELMVLEKYVGMCCGVSI